MCIRKSLTFERFLHYSQTHPVRLCRNPPPPGSPYKQSIWDFLACHVFMPLNVMLIYIHVDCLGREPFQKVICDVMILLGICIMSLISLYHYSLHLHCDDDCIDQIITLTRAASQHGT